MKKKLIALKAKINNTDSTVLDLFDVMVKEITGILDLLIEKIDKYSNKNFSDRLDKVLNTLDRREEKFYDIDKILNDTKEVLNLIQKEACDFKEVAKSFELPKEIKISNQPEEIKVSNLEEIKSIEISNLKEFPKEIEIKKPVWYKQIDFSLLTNAINSAVQTILRAVFRVDLNEYKKESNALAVKIVGKDGVSTDLYDLIKKFPAYYSPGGSGGGGSSSGGTSDIMSADTPVVSTVIMTDANTEYSQALPNKCRKFMIQNRGNYDIKLSFISGQSGTVYWTIKAGMVYYEDMINCNSKVLYIQCATAAQTAEIIYWTN